jgi:hypothetical protein
VKLWRVERLRRAKHSRHYNLRMFEQKVNASDKLTDEDKIDMQQYITRCYR